MAVANILSQTKRWFAFSKVVFCAGTKVFEEVLNAVKFLGWLKKFGQAQNILRPLKGQGISCIPTHNFTKNFHKFFEQSIESVLQFTLWLFKKIANVSYFSCFKKNLTVYSVILCWRISSFKLPLRLSSFEAALVLNNYFSGSAEPGRVQIMPTTLLLTPNSPHPSGFSDLPLTLLLLHNCNLNETLPVLT